MGKADEQAKVLAKAKARLGGKKRKPAKAQKPKKGTKFSLTGGLSVNGWDVGGSSNSVSFSRTTSFFRGGKF